MAVLRLPKNDKLLVDILDPELRSAEMEANCNLVSWKIIDAYMAGLRHFHVIDRWQGEVELAYENIKGEIEFRYEKVVQDYLVELGRYLKMNITPFVTKKYDTLDALRKAAVGHAALGALAQNLPLTKLRRDSLIYFLKYGTVGLHVVMTGDPTAPFQVDVVHPRELRGLPSWSSGASERYGIARKRWVPYGWLREVLKKKFKKDLDKESHVTLEYRDVPWGSTPPRDDSGPTEPVGGTPGSMGNSPIIHPDNKMATRYEEKPPSGEDETQYGRGYVPLEEIFVYTDDGFYLSEYIIKVGRFLAYRVKFPEDGKVMCPLQVARHTDVGRFFARGFLSKLIPVNHAVERLVASLFKNVEELDAFGVMMIPGDSGIDIKALKTGRRPRAMKYNPDPMNADIKPFALQPTNSGPLPARIAEFAMGLMKDLSGQGPMFQGEAAGRTDSAAGHGFLFNTGNIGLGCPTDSYADAWANVYATMLQKAHDQNIHLMQVAVLDEAVAGVTYDAASGTISLAENPLPMPHEVTVDIKDRTARDPNLRKQELLELHARGLVDEIGFWIAAFEESLDFPGAPKEVWETWRKAIWQIVVLFGNGQTPGDIAVGEHTQNPDIQLRAVQRFMDKIEFSLASPQVREAFETWKVQLETLAGQNFPMGLGAPEDVAMQAQGRTPPQGQPGGGQELLAALQSSGLTP